MAQGAGLMAHTSVVAASELWVQASRRQCLDSTFGIPHWTFPIGCAHVPHLRSCRVNRGRAVWRVPGSVPPDARARASRRAASLLGGFRHRRCRSPAYPAIHRVQRRRVRTLPGGTGRMCARAWRPPAPRQRGGGPGHRPPAGRRPFRRSIRRWADHAEAHGDALGQRTAARWPDGGAPAHGPGRYPSGGPPTGRLPPRNRAAAERGRGAAGGTAVARWQSATSAGRRSSRGWWRCTTRRGT